MKGKKTVFIAEDDQFISDIYVTNFKKEGVNTVVFQDGKEVLDALKKQQPDLLILDLHMPNVDGFGVLSALKKIKHSYPIIILSNLRTELDAERCKSLGANDCMVKSDVRFKELWEKVKGYLKM